MEYSRKGYDPISRDEGGRGGGRSEGLGEGGGWDGEVNCVSYVISLVSDLLSSFQTLEMDKRDCEQVRIRPEAEIPVLAKMDQV